MCFVRTRDITHTTTFRLTAAFVGMFGVAILLLLGLVYMQTFGVLSRRVDHILTAEAAAISKTGPEGIVPVIRQKAMRDPLAVFSLFTPSGERVVGNGTLTPRVAPPDGHTHDFPRSGAEPPTRALAERMPWGEILIVQRDTSQLLELKRIILQALLWSGGLISVFGAILSVALSLPLLRRIQATRSASEAIAGGDLTARLPVSGGRDEIDELVSIINAMMDEVERLMTQARTVGEGVAHELRTPLTRLRATLDHLADTIEVKDRRKTLVETCIEEADGVLARFRALLRITAVEERVRRSGVHAISLTNTVEQAVELYDPLAADKGIELQSRIEPDVTVPADAELMVEAISNLIDNALKFTPAGGVVHVSLAQTARGPLLTVSDNGPGIAAEERMLVTKRFYRGHDAANISGHGLGLSLVAAVADLHGFTLSIDDAAPGAVLRLLCRQSIKP
jgi:signal transduction histidine kinase